MEKKKKLHHLKKLNSQKRTPRYKQSRDRNKTKMFVYTGYVTRIDNTLQSVEIRAIDTSGNISTVDMPYKYIDDNDLNNIEVGWVIKVYFIRETFDTPASFKCRFPKRYWKKQVLEVAEAAGETLAKMFDTLDTAVLITNDDPAVVASIVEALNGTPTVLETETERYNKWQIDEK